MSLKTRLTALVGSTALIGLAVASGSLPAWAQDKPESILPPGFGSPAGQKGKSQPPPPPTPEPQPTEQPQPAERPVRIPGTADVPEVELSVPVNSGQTKQTPEPSSPARSEEEEIEESDADLADLPELSFSVSAADARSLGTIGIVGTKQGGFASGAMGDRPGPYLHRLIRNIGAPLVSRWATIMGRRLLASRLDTPEGISGQQYVADRARLLMRMGEANVARSLIQQVDVSQATEPLYDVALSIYLTAVDPAGACPLVNGAVSATDDNRWKMMRPICASLAGEQSRADALYNSARNQGLASGLDLLLAEKLLGASSRRRAVTLEWDGADRLTAWRHGVALSTGVLPPQALYDGSGRQAKGWLAIAPSLPARDRAEAAITAAALGNLSNAALVSLYSEVASDQEASDAVHGRATALQAAYAGNSRSQRLNGLMQLLPDGDGDTSLDNVAYGNMVLASRAAAAIAPDAELDEDVKGWLIGSMLTSGLDRQAATWRGAVNAGSLGWALIAAAAPDAGQIDPADVSDFIDDWDSKSLQKGRLFAAGLAGLGRIDAEALKNIGDDIDTDFSRQTTYTKAIEDAVAKKQPGVVALYALAALQGNDWATVSPVHFYHLIRGLKRTGREAEARMLVAEAVTRA